MCVCVCACQRVSNGRRFCYCVVFLRERISVRVLVPLNVRQIEAECKTLSEIMKKWSYIFATNCCFKFVQCKNFFQTSLIEYLRDFYKSIVALCS